MAQSIFSNKFYDKAVLSNTQKDTVQILSALSIYYEGVELAKTNFIDSVFHAEWLMKDDDSEENKTLHIENKTEFIRRVKGHGPYANYASGRSIVDISIANSNLAYVRVNKQGATSFFLVKINDQWSLLDKMWVYSDKEFSSTKNFVDNQNAVGQLLSAFCKAHTSKNIEALQYLLHSEFEIKEINSTGLKQYKKEELNDPGYTFLDFENNHPYQLVKSEIFQNKLAVLRLDFTQTNISVFIMAMKLKGEWKVISERISNK